MLSTVTIKAYGIVEVQRHVLTWSPDGSEWFLYPHYPLDGKLRGLHNRRTEKRVYLPSIEPRTSSRPHVTLVSVLIEVMY